MIRPVIFFFLFFTSMNVYAIHTFSCGTYLISGTLEANQSRGYALVISEGSYSEVVMYPALSPQLKAPLPGLPFKGYFTIAVQSKETIKENVTLISWTAEENPLGASFKNDVTELAKSPCTKSVKAPQVVEGNYPNLPKEPYKQNIKK